MVERSIFPKLNLGQWFRAWHPRPCESVPEGAMAITIHDGPSFTTYLLLEKLAEREAPATLAWHADNVEKCPNLDKLMEIIRATRSEVCLHGISPYIPPGILPRISGTISLDEMIEGRNKLQGMTNLPVDTFMPHGVQVGPVLENAKKAHMTAFLPDWKAMSWLNTPAQLQAEKMLRRRSIVGIHEPVDDQEITNPIEVLELLLGGAKDRGIPIVTASEYLGIRGQRMMNR